MATSASQLTQSYWSWLLQQPKKAELKNGWAGLEVIYTNEYDY